MRCTFLLSTPAETGHLLLTLEVAHEMASRGHRVLVHTAASGKALVEKAGAELVPFDRYTDLVARMRKAMESRPAWVPKGPFGFWQFTRTIPQCARDLAIELEPIIRREGVDCIAYDLFAFGAAYAAERAGIPHASIAAAAGVIGKNGVPIMFASHPVLKNLARVPRYTHAIADALLPLRSVRTALDLPARAAPHAEFFCLAASPTLHIILASRSFTPAVPLRENQVFAGPSAFDPAGAQDQEIAAPEVQPGTVLVSTTTTGRDEGLLRKVLEGVAPLGTSVLATAASATNLPDGLGSHIQIKPFIPHEKVFPHISALITHGGWGTVGRGLRHGVPMLVIPIFGDQFANARLVEAGGLGYCLPLDKVTPQAVREKLRALLADERIRARARKHAEEIRTSRERATAMDALEQLAISRRPGRR